MTNSLEADLRINQTALSEECARQPALYAYYAEQARLAASRLKFATLDLTVFTAALDRKLRDSHLSRGSKFTERQIETAIQTNDDWIKRKRDIFALESEVEQTEAIVKSIAQKKDMLITIANHQRSEMGMRPFIREAEVRDIPTMPRTAP